MCTIIQSSTSHVRSESFFQGFRLPRFITVSGWPLTLEPKRQRDSTQTSRNTKFATTSLEWDTGSPVAGDPTSAQPPVLSLRYWRSTDPIRMVIVRNLAAPLVPFLDIDYTTAEKCVSSVLYGPHIYISSAIRSIPTPQWAGFQSIPFRHYKFGKRVVWARHAFVSYCYQASNLRVEVISRRHENTVERINQWVMCPFQRVLNRVGFVGQSWTSILYFVCWSLTLLSRATLHGRTAEK